MIPESARRAIVVAGEIIEGDAEAPVLPWWSFTKTALAAVAIKLASLGVIDFSAPVSRADFTIEDVLRHRAGLPDYGAMPMYQSAVTRRDEPWSAEEFIERTRRTRCPPRGRFSYSNIGYLLVRRAIEQATRMDIGGAFDEFLFRPLGVEGARLARYPGDVVDPFTGAPSTYHPGWVAHGLLIGPPHAAAALLDRLMTGDFLPQPWPERMRRGTPAGGPWPDRPWRHAAYGMGLMMDADGPLGRQYGHTGGGPNSVCAVYHFADLTPAATIAIFASGADAGPAEFAAIASARALSAPCGASSLT